MSGEQFRDRLWERRAMAVDVLASDHLEHWLGPENLADRSRSTGAWLLEY